LKAPIELFGAQMALQDSEAMQLQVSVTLLSNTPVIGYKIDPTVLVNPTENAPPHSLVFTWYL
jgi:hypothetical protein